MTTALDGKVMDRAGASMDGEAAGCVGVNVSMDKGMARPPAGTNSSADACDPV